jgi:hypothetical protein
MTPKRNKDFDGPMDWNDTSNPAVREAEIEELDDYEHAGCDSEDDLYDHFEDDFRHDTLSMGEW